MAQTRLLITAHYSAIIETNNVAQQDAPFKGVAALLQQTQQAQKREVDPSSGIAAEICARSEPEEHLALPPVDS